MLFVLLLGGVFLIYSRLALAATRYNISVVNPEVETVRGGPLAFNIGVFGHQQGEQLATGVKYDSRKLRLERIESGGIGGVTSESLPDEGNFKLLVLRTTSTAGDMGGGGLFATVHFTVIDETDELNEEGRGYTEICTLFDVEESDQPQPTTAVPTPTPVNDQPDNPQQPTATPVALPTPTPDIPIDLSQACIPISVKGAANEKLDIVILGANYAPNQQQLMVEDARFAVREFEKTNLRDYQTQILDKMNWYLLNPSEYGRPTISLDEAEEIGLGQTPCSRDRYLILDNDRGTYFGAALVGYGGYVNIQFVKETGLPVLVHEWGHYVGGLADEYEITYNDSYAQEAKRAPNCSDTSSGNDQSPCPKWDCGKTACTAMMQQLYHGLGCYSRCGHRTGYRPLSKSIMDSHSYPPEQEAFVFSAPSVVHLVEKVFSRYE